MDLTKLFLGDVLDGMDLGGLTKLGFNITEGMEKEDSGEESSE